MKIDDLSYKKSYYFDVEIEGKSYQFVCTHEKDLPYIDIEYDGLGYGVCFRAPKESMDDFDKVLKALKRTFVKVLEMNIEGKLDHGESNIN